MTLLLADIIVRQEAIRFSDVSDGHGDSHTHTRAARTHMYVNIYTDSTGRKLPVYPGSVGKHEVLLRIIQSLVLS